MQCMHVVLFFTRYHHQSFICQFGTHKKSYSETHQLEITNSRSSFKDYHCCTCAKKKRKPISLNRAISFTLYNVQAPKTTIVALVPKKREKPISLNRAISLHCTCASSKDYYCCTRAKKKKRKPISLNRAISFTLYMCKLQREDFVKSKT
jgi:hypothetical protein